MFSRTPGSANINKTIHTPTPSRVTSGGLKRPLNKTIGTPGKRARGEFATPLSGQSRPMMVPSMTSTLLKGRGGLPARPAGRRHQQRPADEADEGKDMPSFSTNLSVIAPPEEGLADSRRDPAGGSEEDLLAGDTQNMTESQKTFLHQEIHQGLRQVAYCFLFYLFM